MGIDWRAAWLWIGLAGVFGMNKHTPGPWQTIKKGSTILSIGPCSADEYAGFSWLDVLDHDAHLIAAAPDLLEALENMLLHIENNLSSDYPAGIDVNDRQFQLARAAITKARSQS